MNGRVVVAGILGGLVVFVWGVTSHMVLTLGHVGVAALPAQDTVLQVLGDNVKEQKIYIFPWYDDEAQLNQAYATGPHGILALTPPAGPFSFGKALILEGLSNVVCGLFAALLFAAAAPALAGWRKWIAFGATLGAFASVAIDFSYWNWYGFPSDYFAAALIDSVVGWTLGGLVIGWWLSRKRPLPA
jgi:hypothetical protein